MFICGLSPGVGHIGVIALCLFVVDTPGLVINVGLISLCLFVVDPRVWSCRGDIIMFICGLSPGVGHIGVMALCLFVVDPRGLVI